MAKITYFDFSFFYYASFFLQGFMENAKERGYEFAISHELPAELKSAGLDSEWLFDFAQRGSIFRFEDGNKSALIAVDASNINELYVDKAVSQTLLEISDYYFKVNYNEKVLATDPIAASFADKIRPVANVWPVAPPSKWRYLPKPDPFGSVSWPIPLIIQRLRWLRRYRTLKQYRSLRNVEKDVDVFFVTTYRSDELHGWQNRQRLIVMEELAKDKNLNLITGFASPVRDIPGDFAKYALPYIGYDQYLNVLARSRIGFYIRGTYGCLSTKFGEQMALGKAIVGETLLNNTENMYGYDKFDEQFAFDDPHEMVDRIRTLLQNPQEIEELEQINLNTFENHLAPKPVTADMLDQIEAGK